MATRKELDEAKNPQKRIQSRKIFFLRKKVMTLNIKNYSLQNANAELTHTVQNLKTQLREAENKILSSSAEICKAMAEKNVYQESLKNISNLLPDLITIWNGTNLFASKYISTVTSSLAVSGMPNVPNIQGQQMSSRPEVGQISTMIRNLTELMGSNSTTLGQTNDTTPSTATAQILNSSNSIVPEPCSSQSVENAENYTGLQNCSSVFLASPSGTISSSHDSLSPSTNYRCIVLNPTLSPVEENSSQTAFEDGRGDNNSARQSDGGRQERKVSIVPKLEVEDDYDIESLTSDSAIESASPENGQEGSSSENIISSNGTTLRNKSQQLSLAIVGNDPGSYRSPSNSMITCPSLALMNETNQRYDKEGSKQLHPFSNVFPRRKKGKLTSNGDIGIGEQDRLQESSICEERHILNPSTPNTSRNRLTMVEMSVPVIEASDCEPRMEYYEFTTNPLDLASAISTPSRSGNNRYPSSRPSTETSTLKNDVASNSSPGLLSPRTTYKNRQAYLRKSSEVQIRKINGIYQVLLGPQPSTETASGSQYSSLGDLGETLKVSSATEVGNTSSLNTPQSLRSSEQKKQNRSSAANLAGKRKKISKGSRSSPRIQENATGKRRRGVATVSYKEPSINRKLRRKE